MSLKEEFIKRGYAPGDYFVRCNICGQQFSGDKRATCCFGCAAEQVGYIRRSPVEEAEEMYQSVANTTPDKNSIFYLLEVIDKHRDAIEYLKKKLDKK